MSNNFPEKFQIVGWNPLEHPLKKGEIISVGVLLGDEKSRTGARKEEFTVFTLPAVDNKIKALKRSIEILERAIVTLPFFEDDPGYNGLKKALAQVRANGDSTLEDNG